MGLRFEGHVDVSPLEPVVPVFVEWVTILYAKHPTTTVSSYVGDLALVSERLLDALGRPRPPARPADSLVLPDMISRVPKAKLSEVTFFRAYDALEGLRLGDLHPRNLGLVFDGLGTLRNASGVRRAASAMSNFCDYLVRRDLLADNPMRSRYVSLPRVQQQVPYSLSMSDAGRLFSALALPASSYRTAWASRDVALLAVLLGTGVRLSEATSACVGDLVRGFAGPSLRVMGKGSKSRVVFLPDEAYALVRQYLDERTRQWGELEVGAPLFVRKDGSPFTPRSFQYMVENWFRRAGVHRPAGSSVHLMRHTFATMALDSGATIREVQECLGHVSLDTTKRYLSVTGEQVAAVAAGHPVREFLR